jgi:hypothetical protein
MANIETILEPSKEIKIADKILKIKKLSLKQLLLLTKWFADISQSVKVNADTFKGSKNNADDLIKILEIVNEEKVINLFSLLSNEQDGEFIKNKILDDGAVALEVINAICEMNDFGRIFGNFQKAVELITKQVQERKTNS